MRSETGALAGLCAALGALASHAGEMPLVSTTTIFVTATRLPQTAAPVSQTMSAISESDIANRAPATFPDLLRATPTLHVDRPGASGGLASLYLRGADPSHTVILIDGVKVSDPTNARGGGIDLSTIDPRTVSRVEILPGASSAIYGADAMAGVVNIITHAAGESGARVGTGVGGGGYRNGFVDATLRSGSVALAAEAAGLRDGHTSDDSYARLRTGTLRLNAGDSGDRHMSAWIRLQHQEGASFPEDSGGPMFAARRELEQRHTDGAVAALHGETPTAFGSLRLYSNVFTQDVDVRSPGVAPGLRDPFGLPRSVSAAQYRRWALGAIAVFGSGPDAPVLVGAEYEKERGEDRGTLDFGFFTTPANFSLERRTRSVFTEGRLSLGERLVAQGSVRADDTDAHGTRTTFQAGARYRLGTQQSLAINYGTGFKPPSFFALGHPLVGNPMLKPEESRTLEVSIASDPEAAVGRLGYRAALFRSRYENLVDFDAGPPPRLVNRSNIDIKGYEASARMRMSESLQVRAAVTGLSFDLPPATAPLRSRPRMRATTGAEYRVTPQLVASIAGSWTGRVFDSSIPTGGMYLSPHFVADASLAYTYRGGRLVFALDNAFDKDYQQFIGFPARGRRARLEVSIEL